MPKELKSYEVKFEDEKVKRDKKRIEAINKERKKLSGILKRNDIDPDKLKMAEGLISTAAYMRVTLEEYADDMKKNGHTEPFTQSDKTEPYDRERPIVRLYNAMVKNYSQVMKQLFDMLPNKAAAKDALMQEYEEKYFK